MVLQLQGVAAAECCRLQLQLQRCMAVASAVGTGVVPRASVVRRSMLDVTSTCGSHRVVADNVCALMCTDAIVLTYFCAPVQQGSIEHRGVSLGGSN